MYTSAAIALGLCISCFEAGSAAAFDKYTSYAETDADLEITLQNPNPGG